MRGLRLYRNIDFKDSENRKFLRYENENRHVYKLIFIMHRHSHVYTYQKKAIFQKISLLHVANH